VSLAQTFLPHRSHPSQADSVGTTEQGARAAGHHAHAVARGTAGLLSRGGGRRDLAAPTWRRKPRSAGTSTAMAEAAPALVLLSCGGQSGPLPPIGERETHH
jgi:hypothetical protein